MPTTAATIDFQALLNQLYPVGSNKDRGLFKQKCTCLIPAYNQEPEQLDQEKGNAQAQGHTYDHIYCRYHTYSCAHDRQISKESKNWQQKYCYSPPNYWITTFTPRIRAQFMYKD